MKVKIRLFAMLQEAVGKNELELDLPDSANEEILWKHLIQKYPQLQVYRSHSRLAVNQQYIQGEYRFKNGDEISIIPPVSGG